MPTKKNDNNPTPEKVAELADSILADGGDYLSNLMELASLAPQTRATLGAEENGFLDYLSANSEAISLFESDEYTPTYGLEYGE